MGRLKVVCRTIPRGHVGVEKEELKVGVHGEHLKGTTETRHAKMLVPGTRDVGTVAYQPCDRFAVRRTARRWSPVVIAAVTSCVLAKIRSDLRKIEGRSIHPTCRVTHTSVLRSVEIFSTHGA